MPVSRQGRAAGVCSNSLTQYGPGGESRPDDQGKPKNGGKEKAAVDQQTMQFLPFAPVPVFDGREPEPRDLPELAGTLGQLHGSAYARRLPLVCLDQPFHISDGLVIPDFYSRRRHVVDSEVRSRAAAARRCLVGGLPVCRTAVALPGTVPHRERAAASRARTDAGVSHIGGATLSSFQSSDPHGTASLAIDTTTQAVSRQQYKPYGENRAAANTTQWPDLTYGYLDASKDISTGYTDLGAREYDPGLGRFISADPLLQTTDPAQLGGYTYAGDNPSHCPTRPACPATPATAQATASASTPSPAMSPATSTTTVINQTATAPTATRATPGGPPPPR
jgi:RHS repeat-associated protein